MILLYGCELLQHVDDPELEATEMHFLKILKSETNMTTYGELGQLPLHLLWIERILSY